MAIIIINQNLNDLIKNSSLSPEQIDKIIDLLISSIQNEPDFQLRIILCDLFNILIIEKQMQIQMEKIYEFAKAMLDDGNFFTTGVYLWGLIFNSLDDEIKVESADSLIDISQKALAIDEPYSLIYGTKLLQVVILETSTKIDYSPNIESLVELLIQVLKKAFFDDRNPIECNQIIKIINELYLVELFEQYSSDFAQFAIEVMSQEELPLELRVNAFELIEDDNDRKCALLESCDFKEIEPYFVLFINIMIQFLQNQRDVSDFEFASSFFEHAGATIEGNEVFKFIIQAATKLSATIGVIGTQAGLFLLYSIVESQQEFFTEYIDIIVKYIINYADCDDDYIERYAFNLINEMAEWIAPALSSKLDIIVEFIMKHINHQEGFRTLDYVLDQALHPPGDLLDFIQVLISFIEQATMDQIELIISSIASSISSSFLPIEDAYELICPVLNDALGENNEEIQKVAIKCFGNLAIISPRSASSDIDKLSVILTQVFTNSDYNDDIKLLYESIVCLKKVCQHLPISFEPFFDDFAQILLQILDEAYPIKLNEQEREKQPEEIYDIQAQLLMCIATFINAFPHKMADFGETFYQLLIEAQKNDKLTIPVYQSVKIAVNGFRELEYDCFPIFDITVLSILRNTDNKQMISEFHNTLTCLLINYGEQINREQINPNLFKTICQQLVNGLDIQYTGYLMYELSTIPDIRLINPIFTCLIQFIDLMGPNIQEFTEDIFNVVDHFLPKFDTENLIIPCKPICGYTIEVYAKLSSILADGEKFYAIAAQCILGTMNIKNFELQSCIARSLRYLLLTNTELFETNTQHFIVYSEGIMKLLFTEQFESENLKHSIVAFWCALITTLELTPNEESLAIALSFLPPPISDESIPSVTHFLSFAMKNFPSAEIQEKLPFVAAAAIASIEPIIAKIDQTVIGEMLEVLSSISEQDMPQFVFYKEDLLLNLMNNISKLTSE